MLFRSITTDIIDRGEAHSHARTDNSELAYGLEHLAGHRLVAVGFEYKHTVGFGKGVLLFPVCDDVLHCSLDNALARECCGFHVGEERVNESIAKFWLDLAAFVAVEIADSCADFLVESGCVEHAERVGYAEGGENVLIIKIVELKLLHTQLPKQIDIHLNGSTSQSNLMLY